jgi:hypothetical protein
MLLFFVVADVRRITIEKLAVLSHLAVTIEVFITSSKAI